MHDIPWLIIAAVFSPLVIAVVGGVVTFFMSTRDRK